jgi:hypothetical protein
MLVGSLALMRAMLDAGLNETIREQAIDGLRKLAAHQRQTPIQHESART